MTSKRDPFDAIQRLTPAAVRARFGRGAARQQVRRGGTPESRAASWPQIDATRNPAARALHDATTDEEN
ncbi:hypothetical protein ACHAAC_16100 [Aeromicrobium sp. CF4.19]|uniref:hypothetical protein n=1 Tax=Aeromicrobium sp. CF4.19 TaxID=3373082 RepID=UPI003EE55D10